MQHYHANQAADDVRARSAPVRPNPASAEALVGRLNSAHRPATLTGKRVQCWPVRTSATFLATVNYLRAEGFVVVVTPVPATRKPAR